MENYQITLNPDSQLAILENTPAELVWFENSHSAYTRKTYKDSLKQFCEFLGISNFEELRKVQSIHVIKFRDWLLDQGKSPATVNTRLATLSSIFKHLIEQQVLKVNPVYGVKRMRKEYRRVKTRKLSVEEIKRFLAGIDDTSTIGARDMAMFTLFFNLGVRIGTVVKLMGRDIYMEDGYLVMNLPLKGRKREQVAVNQHIQAALFRYCEKLGYTKEAFGAIVLAIPDDVPLFSQMSSNPKMNDVYAPLTTRGVHYLWQRYAKKAGIEKSSPHSARVSFATEASANSCDIKDLQQTLGHSDIRTTQCYIHADVNHAKSASFAVSFAR